MDMRNGKIVIGAAMLALALAACDPTPGTHCDQLGSKHTKKDGTVMVCIKNVDTGKNFWRENP